MSKIDLSRLTNVIAKDGKQVARCPACAARGNDTKGNNLVVYKDGKFACAAYPGDKEHNRQILQLVGMHEVKAGPYQVPVCRVIHPPPSIIKVVGRFERSNPTVPVGKRREEMDVKDDKPWAVIPDDPLPVTPLIKPSPVIGRPRVPQAIREQMERLKWMPDGQVVDTTKLDDDGNPLEIPWPAPHTMPRR